MIWPGPVPRGTLGAPGLLFIIAFRLASKLGFPENPLKVPRKAMQSNAKKRKAMQSNAKQCKAIQRNAKQCKAMQSNAKQFEAMQSNARQCKAMRSDAKQCKVSQGTQGWTRPGNPSSEDAGRGAQNLGKGPPSRYQSLCNKK